MKGSKLRGDNRTGREGKIERAHIMKLGTVDKRATENFAALKRYV